MTSCLVAINKNRDMCFDMKNGKKTYFSGEIPVNDCRNVWRGLKSIRLIKKIFLRISKVSCKELSRSQSLNATAIKRSCTAFQMTDRILCHERFHERETLFSEVGTFFNTCSDIGLGVALDAHDLKRQKCACDKAIKNACVRV